MPCRGQAKQHSGAEGNDYGKQQRGAVHAHTFEPWNIFRRKAEQQLHTPGRQKQPDQSSESRKQDALGKHLADQPILACPHCPANRDLAITRRRARHRQIRHVRTRNQENEPHGYKQHYQCLLVVADHLRTQGHEHNSRR